VAWRNIWRNRPRSLLVMTSVALGLWAGAFILAYVFGMIDQRLNDAIGNEISHLQLHHPQFEQDQDPDFFIPNGADWVDRLEENEQVQAVTGRVLAYGMVASANSSTGGKLVGLIPEDEQTVTGLQDKIVEGDYLGNDDRNKILLGEQLAKKLKVKLRSKLVLTFQDTSGTIVAGAFRVMGIYKTTNTTFDETNIFTRAQDVRQLLGLEGEYHEIAVLLQDPNTVETFVQNLQAESSSVLVESWKTLAPELGFMIESLDQYMVIFIVIILLALSFGIVNTMLMAILERVREIGMLMAIGMNRTRLFGMITLETLFLVLIASPLGLLLAYLTIQWLGRYGLDLSGIYQGYAAYGFQPIIYPHLAPIYYGRMMLMVAIAAILASIYPSITAIRLNPVTAIRKI
ncbi:MAG: FtsX-like permease family protein, partial [Bacteroidota bacterium]